MSAPCAIDLESMAFRLWKRLPWHVQAVLDREDLVQSAHLAAVRAGGVYTPTICRGAMIDDIRRAGVDKRAAKDELKFAPALELDEGKVEAKPHPVAELPLGWDKLSERERAILAGRERGLDFKQIARELGMAATEVSRFAKRAIKKLESARVAARRRGVAV